MAKTARNIFASLAAMSPANGLGVVIAAANGIQLLKNKSILALAAARNQQLRLADQLNS